MSKTINAIFLLTCSFLLNACATNINRYKGDIAPIVNPISENYSAYTGVETTKMTGSISNRTVFTIKVSCAISVSNDETESYFDVRKECSSPAFKEKVAYDFRMSQGGEVTNIQFSGADIFYTGGDLRKFKQAMKSQWIINNPFRTGTTIFNLEMSNLMGIGSGGGGVVSKDIVRGKSISQGRIVYVLETISIGEMALPNGTFSVSGSGYKLIDEETMAVLESHQLMFLDIYDNNGEKSNLKLTASTSLALQ